MYVDSPPPPWRGESVASIMSEFVMSMLISLFALCLPLAYVYRLVRRQFELSYLMLAPVVAILSMFAWRYLLDPNQSVTTELNESPFLILLGGTLGIVEVILLVWCIRRGNLLILGLIAAGTSAFSLAMIGIPMFMQTVLGRSGTYQWHLEDVFMIVFASFTWVVLLGSPLWVALTFLPKRQRRGNRMPARLQGS